MEDISHQPEEKERPCEAISAANEKCGFPAAVRCTLCKKWFCDAHAEDENWHPCVLSPGFG